MQTQSIELPFFPGFYESPLYHCDTLYNELSNGELDEYKERMGDDSLTYDDFDFDFDTFKTDCAKVFVGKFWDLAPSFVEKVEFDTIVSPKYYNFTTDKVYANITFSDDWKEQVLQFMEDNKEALTKKIKEEWSDRDGFFSFLSNDYDAWVTEFQSEQPDERCISVMLKYIMVNEQSNIYGVIIEEVYSEICYFQYISCTKEDNGAAE